MAKKKETKKEKELRLKNRIYFQVKKKLLSKNYRVKLRKGKKSQMQRRAEEMREISQNRQSYFSFSSGSLDNMIALDSTNRFLMVQNRDEAVESNIYSMDEIDSFCPAILFRENNDAALMGNELMGAVILIKFKDIPVAYDYVINWFNAKECEEYTQVMRLETPGAKSLKEEPVTYKEKISYCRFLIQDYLKVLGEFTGMESYPEIKLTYSFKNKNLCQDYLRDTGYNNIFKTGEIENEQRDKEA